MLYMRVTKLRAYRVTLYLSCSNAQISAALCKPTSPNYTSLYSATIGLRTPCIRTRASTHIRPPHADAGSNRSISSARLAHSSKPSAGAGLLLWTHAGTDRRLEKVERLNRTDTMSHDTCTYKSCLDYRPTCMCIKLRRTDGQRDRRTDTAPLRRPCFACNVGSSDSYIQYIGPA